MTCDNCKATWTYPAGFSGATNKCPFCGKLLLPEHGSATSLDGVLSCIADTFGGETMKDGAKLLGLFADLAPNLKREKILLRHFLECGGNDVLLKAVSAETAEARAMIRSVIARTEQELMVMPDAAKSVCLAFWTAIGGSGDVQNNNTASTAPEKPAAVAVVQPVVQRPAPTQQHPVSQSRDEDLSWKRSEAAHRAWLNSQKKAYGMSTGGRRIRFPLRTGREI